MAREAATYTGKRPGRQRGVTTNVGAAYVDLSDVSNEIAEVWINADGGTFKLAYDGVNTSGIAYNVSTAALETELELFAGITTATITGSGSKSDPWIVTLDGSADITLLAVGDASTLTSSFVDADRVS